ncbi:MAG: hypothetical protein OEY56_10060 [Cyclobacteriaceae bacterium]|nr:hypothetical protein [Cyclobacteriaceae bacterium]
MKVIFSGIVLVSLTLLSSCFDLSRDVMCGSSSDVSNVELYVIELAGQQSVALDPAIPLVNLCQYYDPAGVNSFQGIYHVDGTVIEDCSTEACISVRDLASPFCVVVYDTIVYDGTTTYQLLQRWEFANFFNTLGQFVHPPCNVLEPYFDFSPGETATNSVSGLARFQNSYQMVLEDRDSLIFVNQIESTSIADLPPYTAIVETMLQDFFALNASIRYKIIEDEMTLTSDKSDWQIKLYQKSL